MQFIKFEIQERQYSPNAVIGITGDNKKVFIAAPASSLGKELGDKIAEVMRAGMERRLLRFELQQQHPPILECPNCKHLQSHSYPMSGKLHCTGCGVLLDEIVVD
jgi:hypothetical protein